MRIRFSKWNVEEVTDFDLTEAYKDSYRKEDKEIFIWVIKAGKTEGYYIGKLKNNDIAEGLVEDIFWKGYLDLYKLEKKGMVEIY